MQFLPYLVRAADFVQEVHLVDTWGAEGGGGEEDSQRGVGSEEEVVFVHAFQRGSY